MSDRTPPLDRRDFFKTAGAGLGAASLALGGGESTAAAPQQWSEKDRLARIASCSYPIRYIFKSRPPANPSAAPAGRGNPQANGGMTNAQMKEKYGEITMLEFPQFTKDTFPGVTHMDLFSGLFGDVTDDSMFAGRTFDPSTPSGKKWLEKLAARMSATYGCEVPAHLRTTRPPIWRVPTTRCARLASKQRKSGSRPAPSSASSPCG